MDGNLGKDFCDCIVEVHLYLSYQMYPYKKSDDENSMVVKLLYNPPSHMPLESYSVAYHIINILFQ